MTTRFNSRITAALLSATLLTASAAFAEPPNAADVETARGLYVEGLELRDGGKLEMSLARFKAAHSLAATPITSLELGRAHTLLAELVEARDVLLSVERMPVQPGESPKAANARLEAHAMAEQLRERIPSMRIVFVPEPHAPPRVTIDGVAIPAEALATPRKVNPGNHVVVADANGVRATASVLLVERELRMVTLELRAGSPSTQPAPPGPSPGPEPGPAPSGGGAGPWFYAGLGAAGVGIVVGTITGAIALSKANALETECTGNACPRSASDDLSTSRTMGVVSTIAFCVAGAGAALAVVSYLTRPSATTNVLRSPNALRWTW